MNDFRNWLSQKLKQYGWSHRELGRQAEVSQTLITRVLSGDMPASADFCIKMATTFETSPVAVLKLAGHLSNDVSPDEQMTIEDDTLQKIITLVRNLPPKERDLLLEFIYFLQSRTNVS